MPTSAGGIITPNDGDGYDLTVDLAAMANSIDSAIANNGPLRKGTVAQRTSTTGLADGTLWQDTDGIKMIWRWDSTVAGNWAPAVKHWSGTTAQRTSFLASAPAGFTWLDTSTNLEWIKIGTAWRGKSPITGSVTFGASNGETLRETVTFPSGYFTVAPRVATCTANSAPSSYTTSQWTGYTVASASSVDILFARPSGTAGNIVVWTATPAFG